MNKSELRNIIKAQRNNLTVQQVHSLSERITDLLISLNEYKNSDSIYLYSSVKNEADTDKLFGRALRDCKTVSMPKVSGKLMEFYTVRDLSDLACGYMGILEPVTDERFIGKSNLLILPGLAFDKNFNRLGYGGGYYDRYLSAHDDIDFIKIGICYDFQFVENIETDVFDRKVDIIVTESRIIRADE